MSAGVWEESKKESARHKRRNYLAAQLLHRPGMAVTWSFEDGSVLRGKLIKLPEMDREGLWTARVANALWDGWVACELITPCEREAVGA